MSNERKPATTVEPDGFLGRWSRRKAEARHGAPLAEPPRQPDPVERQPAQPAAAHSAAAVQKAHEAPPVLPGLADVQALTAESDFSSFMMRGVAPAVRNAAMKKLFSDPRFNVMDGLDVYIDDYTKTTPLSAAMLKSMSGAKFLGLLDDEKPDEKIRSVEEAAAPDAAKPPSDDVADTADDEPKTAAGPLCSGEPPVTREPREPC